MRVFDIDPTLPLMEREEVVEGTHCGNCKYSDPQRAKPVDKDDLNKQGGVNPQNDHEMKRAKESDLITMPGKPRKMPTHKVPCTHARVKQYVSPRMCCAFWDAPGTLRPYGKQVLGKSES